VLLLLADHNIPPRLDKQLILMLKVREEELEVFHWLPCRFRLIQTSPQDKDNPSAATQLGLESTCRLEQQSAMPKGWKSRQQHRRSTMERLQNTHMKNIMDAGTLRKTKPICHLADALDHLEGTRVPRTELAARP